MKSLLLATAALVATPALAVDYDVAAGFSGAANPNGPYSYGYSATLGGAFSRYTVSTTYSDGSASWRETSIDPYLGVYGKTGSSSVSFHPGPSGQYSVLRLTVADAGTYTLAGTYSNGNNATTDVNVLVDGVSVFAGTINNPGGVRSTGFNLSRTLNAGSIVDFAVGPNGDYFYDSTNLTAAVNLAPAVPEPATWGMMLLGFGLVGAGLRRRTAVLAAA